MDKRQLNPLEYEVTQNKGTEPPFSGKYNNFSEAGAYHCKCCDQKLFNSSEKFHSSCGWPAFSEAISQSTIERIDLSHNMSRIEILCSNCDSHLGHKFDDGPTGTRYCINSVSLNFEPCNKT